MNRRTILTGALACVVAGGALAQGSANVPKGTVRITSIFPTGSGPDVVVRLVAEKLTAKWGQPVVIDAKPGGAGIVAINAMKNAPPTGNDLVLVDVGQLSINPLIFKKLPYDPEKDLVPVAMLYKTAFFVAVAADGPYRTLPDLLTAAKSKTLTYGSSAVGGPGHLGSARLESALGTEMTHVPFKETSQLYAAVATGEVSWSYGSIATAGALVRAGKLRFIAVADHARSPAMPEVPTLEEAGGPRGLDAIAWVAIMAPAGTPPAVTTEINKGVNEALAAPDVKEKLATFGFAGLPGPVQQVVDYMQTDRARYAEVLKRVRVSID